MKIDVLTLFPEMVQGPMTQSIIGKAIEAGKIEFETTDFRQFSNNKHNHVDDYPFGGGAGMLLKVEPIDLALASIRERSPETMPRVISTTDFAEERYKKGTELAIFKDGEFLTFVTVASHRRHKNFDLLTFEGMNRIEDVEKYKECLLKVAEEQLTELEDDEFYYHEIIGLEIVTDEGEVLGEVTEILSPGSNDVWVVKQKGKKELLIPFIEPVVYKVDKEEKKAYIHLLEGLID